MTPDIMTLIHEREDFVSLFMNTGNDVYLERARSLRRRINLSVRYAKADEIKQALEENRDNPKAFWRTINDLVKPSQPVEPPTLIGDDATLKSNQDSVEYLNSYFVSCLITWVLITLHMNLVLRNVNILQSMLLRAL